VLNPEAALSEVVESLVDKRDHVGLTLDDYVSKQTARRLVVRAIRATHAILHPECRFTPAGLEVAIERLERDE
jgi:hypothetical protein